MKHIDEDYSHGSPPKELEDINNELLEESDISKSPSRKFGSSNDEVEEDD